MENKWRAQEKHPDPKFDGIEDDLRPESWVRIDGYLIEDWYGEYCTIDGRESPFGDYAETVKRFTERDGGKDA